MGAAVALSEEGYRVSLVEKRALLGGRAGSLLDATSGEWVDNCQHVLMPCCTNLLDFYRRMSVGNKIRFYPEIPFIDRNGRMSFLKASLLPAPLHSLPAFLALKFLSPADKLRIARGLASLLFESRSRSRTDVTALAWLRAHGQSARAIQNFWEPVLISALNETLDRASIYYAGKVFLDAFLSDPKSWWLGIPTVPLSSLYGDPIVQVLERGRGEVRLRTEVERVVVRDRKVTEIALANGEILIADIVIVALPWDVAAKILPEQVRQEIFMKPDGFQGSPITGVHLWFDRPVTNLDFAALPGGQVQWFFNKSRTFERNSAAYLQLVTSASRAWMNLSKNQILEIALDELKTTLPETRAARVVKSHVLKEPMATFSPAPEIDRARPPAATAFANLFLAGDWIQTGWPATMEGAVRGGYLAAEAVLRADGRPKNLVVPDMPATGLMRWLYKQNTEYRMKNTEDRGQT
jgi:zeta-carotene desaturase